MFAPGMLLHTMLNTGGRGGLGWHVKFNWCRDQRYRATALSFYQAMSSDKSNVSALQPTVRWEQRYEGSQRKDLKAKAYPHPLLDVRIALLQGQRLGQRLTSDQCKESCGTKTGSDTQ